MSTEHLSLTEHLALEAEAAERMSRRPGARLIWQQEGEPLEALQNMWRHAVAQGEAHGFEAVSLQFGKFVRDYMRYKGVL